ncbi:hypothetical protein B0H10DRAFT_2444241 [Mycena sp. CBHHK59/15]|nr:hypothetical protein B0H10DRAFT_2444241 [Mycena sp. CBHHK59/15]
MERLPQLGMRIAKGSTEILTLTSLLWSSTTWRDSGPDMDMGCVLRYRRRRKAINLASQ